ncbi:hypothetical protein PC116_g33072 [Phytophthora cactorum]|nr:hypothetical protein PC116_g33072 [Phytophthora cactorum]
MESACHTGYECTYDTVADHGWRVGIGTHKIRSVINDVIRKYDDVPECKLTPDCRDCANWKMYESNSTDGTTTSSSTTTTKTRTRTATCQTPGWYTKHYHIDQLDFNLQDPGMVRLQGRDYDHYEHNVYFDICHHYLDYHLRNTGMVGM